MSSRPDLELALDVRSYESIVVLASPDNQTAYPESWVRPTRGDLGPIDDQAVVVIDRVDVQRRTLSLIGEARPRLLALVPQGVEQEKSMRRLLTSVFPWAEVWTIFTSFGKLLVTKDAHGRAYDRDDVVDMRAPTGVA